MNYNKVAEAICQKNPSLVEYVHNNPDNNYQGIRKALSRVVSAIGKTYNEGKFVTSKDLHALTWAVINIANGDTEQDDLSLEV